MASSKLMASQNSSKTAKPHSLSDRSHINSSPMTVDGLLRTVYSSDPSSESALLDAQITLVDAPAVAPKSVEDVWREIVSGDVKECKEEAPDEMMTLEDFLARAGAAEEEDDDVKVPPAERLSGGVFTFDLIPQSSFQAADKVEGSVIGFRNGVSGRGKRARPVLEPLDKAAQQRQRRMIKNRESAARSRERKQAYQVELETLAVKLEEENEMLLKEKAERTRKRLQQLMGKVVPVVEKQRPARALRRVRSL